MDEIGAIKAVGLRGQVKIIVGGSPLSPQFAETIGAEGDSCDANHVVALVKSLL